jgi:hypothetical protein
MTTIKTTGTDIQDTTSGTSTTSTEDSLELTPPVMPELETFSMPKPAFDSNLERYYRFGYFFGLDDVSFKSRNVNMTCGRITKEIEIGAVELIELESVYSSSSSSSVEFSIIDQGNEIPIVPIHDDIVHNERIFFGLPLRFTLDRSKPYQIKKDGVDIEMTPEAAMNANDGVYTITYSPLNAHQYQPKGRKVQIKVVMRLYDKGSTPPFVKSALIRAYGGEALWIDRL